ncbi:MAG: excinuclease ABC subunit UvrB [Clostridia bacterium]|nr:excinuclease ABC subunit UvrB [Clostridia bacterium]
MEQKLFHVVSEYEPKGDQPEAIDALAKGIEEGDVYQTLLGVTGSGKTYTMAKVIEKVQRPTLVLAHNKTLAAQLCSEFREFFPDNAVEFFVSYYDYYQPEAYIAATDTYIEKDSSVNDEIDRLRHSATAALLERRDVIIVASVSCIYGLGDPEDYTDLMVSLRPGMRMEISELSARLAAMNYVYDRSDFSARNSFRVSGDTLSLRPSDRDDVLLRIEFFGDEIERICECDASNFTLRRVLNHAAVFPASHYATTDAKLERAIGTIGEELEERLAELKSQNKIVEAYRLEQRTRYDMELLRETKFCNGIENYSRHISGRAPGSPPYTLLDYFPDDFIMFIDESHATLPQVRAMYNGDHARKVSLVEYGFRLPSAFDNRPLKFDEFEDKLNQVVFVSATPSEFERSRSVNIVEQIIRPTGLVDPEIEVRPVEGQIDDLVGEINSVVAKNERVLVTTLTKKMAEKLTSYLSGMGIKVEYMHSDVKTIDRMALIRDLRLGVFDVLVGINLLREGLDLPEVSRVAILDADKVGFLRSEVSLIQTIGRAARNASGKVIMYADRITDAMKDAINETNRRRRLQLEFNRKNGIVPKTITKSVREVISTGRVADDSGENALDSLLRRGRTAGYSGDHVSGRGRYAGNSRRRTGREDASSDSSLILTDEELELSVGELLDLLTGRMAEAAGELRFEEAAKYRDIIKKLRASGEA